MKLLLIRHGIGRSHELVNQFNRVFLEGISTLYDTTSVYIYRPVEVICSTRTSSEAIQTLSKPSPIFPWEDIIYVPPLTKPPDFSSVFKYDHYNDNYSSFNNLYFQHQTLRIGIKSINLDKYDAVICYRDDVILSSKKSLMHEFSRASSNYLTSMFDWHDGVFERFYACSPRVFRLMVSKDLIIFDKFKEEKCLLASSKFTGECLTRILLESARIPIWPLPLYTYRVRSGPRIACETNHIRFQDFHRVAPYLLRRAYLSRL